MTGVQDRNQFDIVIPCWWVTFETILATVQAAVIMQLLQLPAFKTDRHIRAMRRVENLYMDITIYYNFDLPASLFCAVFRSLDITKAALCGHGHKVSCRIKNNNFDVHPPIFDRLSMDMAI